MYSISPCWAPRNMSTEYSFPDFDLGTFRYAAARYVKMLIRARWRCQPGFFPVEELARWELQNIDTDLYPSWRLLMWSATALGTLNHEFLPRCGSGGVFETDPHTPEGRLIYDLSFLVNPEGGGPYHNEALLQAARNLSEERTVDWDSLVEWSWLPRIRADLDQLPHPHGSASSRSRNPDSDRSHGENIFRRDDNFWFVSFSNKVVARPDGPGMFYIHLLLGSEKRIFDVSEMRSAYASWSTDKSSSLRARTGKVSVTTSRDENEKGDDLHQASGNLGDMLDDDDLHTASGNLGDMLDDAAEEDYQRRLAEVQGLLHKAIADTNSALVAEYRREM